MTMWAVTVGMSALCATAAASMSGDLPQDASRSLREGGAAAAPAFQAQEFDDEYKIQLTELIKDNEYCHSSSTKVSMCASRNFVCRMPDGQQMFAKPPSCLPVVPNADDVDSMERTGIAPWSPCDPSRQEDRGSPCKRQFQCRCKDGDSSYCYCVPPDAVAAMIGSKQCGESSTSDCKDGEYCRWEENGTEACSLKPYYS